MPEIVATPAGHVRLRFHLPDTWYGCIMEAEQGVRGRQAAGPAQVRRRVVKRQRSAFTLVELLVVISIIGVLAALLFPVVGGAILGVAEVECQNHLSQLAMVVRAYCAEHQGSFPLYAQQNIRGSASNWLYGLNAARKPDFKTGILVSHKYIGTEDILYCPVDAGRGMSRATSALMNDEGKPPTSYVINGSITYGGGIESSDMDAYMWSADPATQVRSRNISDFDPVDFLFIEQSSGVKPEPEPSKFSAGYMTPNFSKFALTNRHHGGGFVSCMDGHVEWFSHEKFTKGMKKVYGSGAQWYRNTFTRPSNTPPGEVSDEEIGARWNPG